MLTPTVAAVFIYFLSLFTAYLIVSDDHCHLFYRYCSLIEEIYDPAMFVQISVGAASNCVILASLLLVKRHIYLKKLYELNMYT